MVKEVYSIGIKFFLLNTKENEDTVAFQELYV